MPTLPLPQLTSDGEDVWLRLKRHVEWCDNFALIFIFSAHPQVIRVFRERLADIYRARVTRLHIPIPEEPAQLYALMPELLRPSDHIKALNAPYWLDLSFEAGEEWKSARLNFLMRLNERREALRQTLERPLIFILPLAEFPEIREVVPDLWSIRQFSLTTGPWIVSDGEQAVRPSQETLLSAPAVYSEYDQAIIREWERVNDKESTDRGILLAGFRAHQVFSAFKENDAAFDIAGRLLEFSKKQIERIGETPESLRDLSVSLNKVGNTARALGELDDARRSYEESLRIRRTIIERIGETPESLRDLSVSLEKVKNLNSIISA